MNNQKYVGVWPVMLTPFNERKQVDWASLERLVDWYIANGVHGLFAVCQSSEMFFLSDKESAELAQFIVKKADGRVPVVASGHTGNGLIHQSEQLSAMAETGVDGVIMIANRLAQATESDEQALENLQFLTSKVTDKVDLGIYECPYPYKRLLSDEIVKWCADSNRFTFIKDTCCHMPTIRRRLALAEGSRLHLANANSQTLLSSFKAGCKAFSGVMANFHPALYVWLYENWQSSPDIAQQLSDYLSIAAGAENLDYPIGAKYYQQKIGNFSEITCRVRSSNDFINTFYPEAVDSMVQVGETLRQQLNI